MYNVVTNELSFIWDARKSKSNSKKHGVSFEEAKTAFFDDNAILIRDEKHTEEERFVLIGISDFLRLLVVVHCFRNGNSIRIISARKATKKESESYATRKN